MSESKRIDWTNDEAVVKAVHPNYRLAAFQRGTCRPAYFIENENGVAVSASSLDMREPWKFVRAANTAVVAFEQANRPAAPKAEEAELTQYVRKQGRPVKAVRWTGANLAEVQAIYPGLGEEYMRDKGCAVGFWVITPTPGRVYFMDHETFVETYEQFSTERAGAAIERAKAQKLVEALEWCIRHLKMIEERDYPNSPDNMRRFTSRGNAELALAQWKEQG